MFACCTRSVYVIHTVHSPASQVQLLVPLLGYIYLPYNSHNIVLKTLEEITLKLTFTNLTEIGWE
jgi:hypothetical protein